MSDFIPKDRLDAIVKRVKPFPDGCMLIDSSIKACSEYEAHLMAKQITSLLEVLDCARGIRHWHDAMRDNSGMVVSAEHVRNLWASITKYDKDFSND